MARPLRTDQPGHHIVQPADNQLQCRLRLARTVQAEAPGEQEARQGDQRDHHQRDQHLLRKDLLVQHVERVEKVQPRIVVERWLLTRRLSGPLGGCGGGMCRCLQ